jgi:glycerol-3-phosphate cytidylyltransferase
MNKTIITYGTFDLFHVGHVNLLKRLKGLGDKLVVGLSTDDFNLKKGKSVVFPYDHRKKILESCRFVDRVFAENCWEQKRDDIIREKVDIFAIGDDWSGKFDELSEICEVVYLPRTPNVSTTEVKDVLKSLKSEDIQQIKNVTEHLRTLVEKL